MASGHGFFEELKRRHVWRVAVAYAVAGWLLVQIATQVFPFFDIPDWGVRLVVILIAIGFPVAVAFAWIYELTPEGIRRTESVDSPEARPEPEHRQIGRKLNAFIVAVLVLAVALLAWRLYAVRHATVHFVGAGLPATAVATTPPAASGLPHASHAPAGAGPPATGVAATPSIPEKSVAVLPFGNDSGDKDQRFFSDGLSEDLITALSQFAGLKVISRDSAFQFRDSHDTSAEIGRLLGVAHLLEGTVQRLGDEVRITATLVNASNGSIVWSQHYDKPYKDLFALQDAITTAVADALKAKLLIAPGAVVQSDRPPSGNTAAWTAFQQGTAYANLGTEAGIRRAVAAFQQAIKLDPRYATAYAALSGAWFNLANVFLGGNAKAQANTEARAAATTALKLNPDSARAHAAHGDILLSTFDWTRAEADYKRALQLAPNSARALGDLAFFMAALGQNQRAVDLIHRSLTINPRNAIGYTNLAGYLAALGQLDAAHKAVDTAIALQPGSVDQHAHLAEIEIYAENPKGALAAAQKEPPGPWHDVAMALALQVGPDHAAANAALNKLIAQHGHDAPYQIAEVYALRGDADDTFKWLDRAWANRDGGITQLLSDPFILRYRHDPRFAAFCRKVGLPTTTDAVAMQ